MSAPAATPQPSQRQPLLTSLANQTLRNTIQRLAATGKLSPAAADELRRIYSR